VLARVIAFDLLGSELALPAGYALAGPIGIAIGLHTVMTASAALALIAVTALALPVPLRQCA
jgi:hypothetical protein